MAFTIYGSISVLSCQRMAVAKATARCHRGGKGSLGRDVRWAVSQRPISQLSWVSNETGASMRVAPAGLAIKGGYCLGCAHSTCGGQPTSGGTNLGWFAAAPGHSAQPKSRGYANSDSAAGGAVGLQVSPLGSQYGLTRKQPQVRQGRRSEPDAMGYTLVLLAIDRKSRHAASCPASRDRQTGRWSAGKWLMGKIKVRQNSHATGSMSDRSPCKRTNPVHA
jgi:hypothetical protein